MKELREERHLSLSYVASQLNITRDRLRAIEKCESYLPIEFLPTLSKLYCTTKNKIVERRIKEWEEKNS